MLAFNPSSTNPTPLTPNLLPCKIAHSGPIRTSQRHWNPTTTSNDPKFPHTPEVHFRGRKLRGRKVKLPANYTGIVAQKSGRLVPRQRQRQEVLRRRERFNGEFNGKVDVGVGVGVEDDDDEDEDEDEDEGVMPIETKALEITGNFTEVMVWAHEAVPDSEDLYVRGIEEWIGFAESIHAYASSATSVMTMTT